MRNDHHLRGSKQDLLAAASGKLPAISVVRPNEQHFSVPAGSSGIEASSHPHDVPREFVHAPAFCVLRSWNNGPWSLEVACFLRTGTQRCVEIFLPFNPRSPDGLGETGADPCMKRTDT